MLNSIKKLFGKTYFPLNKIEINKDNLYFNYQYLSQMNPSLRIAPVLKSNAYGHGLVQIAKLLDNIDAPFLCVDSIYEAYELLKKGLKTKILVMGYVEPQNLKVKHLPFSYAVFNTDQLSVINQYQKNAGIHIKFDSGMSRLGVTFEELPEFISTIKQYNNITIEGFMSHFAESEFSNSTLTKLQIANFKNALNLLKESNISPRWIHFANSEGILNNKNLELSKYTNIGRTGLALYGIGLSNDLKDLQPVLKLTTKIIQIKSLKKGDKVGYNGTFTAKENMTIAILPIGYNDGVDRRLSNKGIMIINKQQCPIIGNISMNISTINISNVSNPYVGQEVIVYSNEKNDPNTIYKSAKICGTIPYELLVHLSPTTRREIE